MRCIEEIERSALAMLPIFKYEMLCSAAKLLSKGALKVKKNVRNIVLAYLAACVASCRAPPCVNAHNLRELIGFAAIQLFSFQLFVVVDFCFSRIYFLHL